MNRSLRWVIGTAVGIAAVAAWMQPAQSATPGDADKRQDIYWVTLIRDHHNTLSVEAIRAMDFEEREKQILETAKAAYDAAVEQWTAAKKEAEATGKEFLEPKPTRPSVTKYKRIFGKEKATAEAARLQKKAAEGDRSTG